MRTTIDIPDNLLRRAKSTAALRGVTLKELVASFIETGLSVGPAFNRAPGQQSRLPDFPQFGIAPIPSYSSEEIEEILLNQELERLDANRPSGR